MNADDRTMNRFQREFRSFPAVSRLGLVVIVAAGVMDVVVHLLGSPAAHDHGFAVEHAAHLLGIVGMALVLAGVVIHGARRNPSRRSPAATTGGLDRHAPR
jgi:hypothetical protein